MILQAESAQQYHFSELMLCSLVLNFLSLGVNYILKAHFFYKPYGPRWSVDVIHAEST